MLTMPFAIGDVMWLPAHYPTKVTVTCPVCFGNLAVVVTLGDGEQVAVPCDACGLGFNGPRGTIEEYQYAPKAIRFEIARVKSMRDDEWYVESVDGGEADFARLVSDEAEALAVSAKNCADQQESNMRTLQRHRNGVQRLTWSVRYHNEKIADLERQIAWHRAKVQKRKPAIAKAEARS
jgi:hypothetical protein